MTFAIDLSHEAIKNLQSLRPYDRHWIRDRLKEELTHQPDTKTRNKKPLLSADIPWETTGVVWEHRIGEFRAFYEVDRDDNVVLVGAVRHKPPHKTTGEVL